MKVSVSKKKTAKMNENDKRRLGMGRGGGSRRSNNKIKFLL